jgi:hypothetical protein
VTTLLRVPMLLQAATLGLAGFVLLPGTAKAFVDPIEAEFHLRWAWSVAGSAIGRSGLEAIDLDSDGDAEILVAADPWDSDGYWYILERQGDRLAQIYTSLPRADGVKGVATGVEDGRVRIVVAGTTSLSVYDGATHSEIAAFSAPTAFQENLAVADIDNDGILDAITCDFSNLYVYELLLGTVRTKFGFGCDDIAIGQTDSDPQLEIALAGNTSGGFLLDGVSLAVDWADPRGFGDLVCLGDFDADGLDEVAAQAPVSGGLRVQDPVSNTLLWESLSGYVTALAASDVDAEPGAELLWGEGDSARIHVLDGATSTELHSITALDGPVTAIAVGDTNADGTPDVHWGAGWPGSSIDALYVASTNSTSFEARTEEWAGPITGIEVGDFLGDGGLEVATALSVVSDFYIGSVPVVLSFASGRVVRFAPGGWPGAFGAKVESTEAAQLDADPQLEICLAGFYQLGCYDGADFAEQWFVALPKQVYTVGAGEIDGDPTPELVVGTEEAFVFAFEGDSGWLKWRTPQPDYTYPPIHSVQLLDLLGDSRQEVVATPAAGSSTSLTTFDGASGLVAAGPWTTNVASTISLPSSVAPDLLLVGRSDGGIVSFNPLTGAIGPILGDFPQAVAAFGLADFNRDGTHDIAALLGNHFQIQDGETGTILYTSPYLGYLAESAEAFLVGDFDGNTVPEVLVGSHVGLALFEAPLFVVFADGFESGDTSSW